MHRITRRRAFRIVAAAAGLPLLIAGVRAAQPRPRFFTWQGEVLGAASELALWHADAALARRAILKVRHEIARYEGIFSLYRDSEVTRLNRDGCLAMPSPGLVEVIDVSQRLGTISGGAFDITVQPLWRTYEAHFWSRSGIAPDIRARTLDVAHALVDFRRVQAGAKRIDMPPGMAVTLNGIAQGFITDRIADLLRNEGFDRAVVDLGEWRALGSHPEGRPWRAATRGGSVELSDNALAVSSGAGTAFEPSGQFHHIFDPATGASAAALAEAAVIAPRAMIADALATAICVVGEERAGDLLAAYPGTRTVVTRTNGTVAENSRRHPEALGPYASQTRVNALMGRASKDDRARLGPSPFR